MQSKSEPVNEGNDAESDKPQYDEATIAALLEQNEKLKRQLEEAGIAQEESANKRPKADPDAPLQFAGGDQTQDATTAV